MEHPRSRFGVPKPAPSEVAHHADGQRLAIANRPGISRRSVIGGGLAGLGGLLLFPTQSLAKRAAPPAPFVILLKGLYAPVAHAPNLGLSMVNLNDGSYSTTSIYPVDGTPGNKNPNKSIGRFYVQFDGELCAYHIPGGSFAMKFIDSDVVVVDDGQGGQLLEGTFELTILEGTGRYRPYVGGHNHMVDKLHFLASGAIDEYCFCFISAP